MLEVLSYDFIQNAIICGVLVSIITGIIGSLIVVNRMVFLSGGIAHTSYGGIGMAVYFGFNVFLGATIFAVAASLLIAMVSLKKRDRIDTIIGLIWAIGMAIGIIFVDLTPGYSVDLMSYLFGSILAVNSLDIYYISSLLIAIVIFLLLFYRDILAVSYDSEYARLRGVNTTVFYSSILILSALSIVVSIKVVGLILVIALLTIPVYISERFSNSLSKMMFLSSLISVAFTVVGLFLSYVYDITSGASIILFGALCMLIVLGFGYIKDFITNLYSTD